MKYFSTFNSDAELLQAFSDIFLKSDWFDADITYSKGVFYTDIKQPKEKYDLIPLFDDVIEQDSQSLEKMKDCNYKSIVFDPPFLFKIEKQKIKIRCAVDFLILEVLKNLLQCIEIH